MVLVQCMPVMVNRYVTCQHMRFRTYWNIIIEMRLFAKMFQLFGGRGGNKGKWEIACVSEKGFVS